MNRLPTVALALALAAVAGCTASKKDGCSVPDIRCGDRCVDGGSDPSNCGACGHVCGATESCCNSQCVDVHGTGAALPLVDNCGACGHRCPTGASCTAGTCACPGSLPTTCGTSPGECVDLTADPDNCSTCGLACNGVGATPAATCAAGTCGCSGTETSFDCGGNPRCVNRQVDGANCGACGRTCQNHSTCAAGACVCGGAYPDNCGTTPNPVCVNELTDASNCGGCGASFACSTGKTCSSGHCCTTGQTWCASASACVNTRTDPNNCGSCGHTCAAGQTCTGGSCGCAGPTPIACGSSCCAGTACCSGGTACQPVRSNGLGGTFYSGCDATLDRSLALAAANSWQTGIQTYDLFCAGNCLARQTNTSCAMWCYDGSYAGRVAYDPTSVSCTALCGLKLQVGQSTAWP